MTVPADLRRRDYLLLVALVAVIYLRALGHEFLWNWDDNWYVLYNESIRGFSLHNIATVFSSVCNANYAPLQMLSYMADYTVWGLNAPGFVATNIVLHAINGILVYRLFLHLYPATQNSSLPPCGGGSGWGGKVPSREGEGSGRLFALVGAAFFLVHPLQVESVAWISCRKNVLSLLFFLLSWEWYLRYRNASEGEAKRVYWSSVVAFLFSLMAKSTTLVLPLILMVYDLCFPAQGDSRPSSPPPWWGRVRAGVKVPTSQQLSTSPSPCPPPVKGGGTRGLARYLPYFAAALLFGLVSMWFQQPNFQGGIRAPYHGGSPLATCFTMLPVFCTYLLRLVWPVGLSAVYAPRIHTSIDIPVLVAGVVLVAVMYGGIRLWRADRRLGFWFVFFWLGLLPFAQIMPIDWLITDRYMNVSIIGAAALAGAGATALVNRFPRLPRLYIHALLVTGIAALAAVSFVRAGVWSDPVTLWSDAAAKSPESDKAWQELGESLNQAGRTEEARRAYERGLQVDPESQGNLAGLGYLLTNLGELDKGKACLDKLVRLRPDYAVAWGSLGWNYQKRGENEAAERMYRKSLELQPEAWTILIELGNLERQRGDLASARRHYEEAEARTGGKPESAYGLACVEARSAKPDTAFLWLEKALQRGYGATDTVYEETDLSTLWEDPRFGSLMRRYFTSASGEQQAR